MCVCVCVCVSENEFLMHAKLRTALYRVQLKCLDKLQKWVFHIKIKKNSQTHTHICVWNRLNNCTSNYLGIYCNPISPPTIPNGRNPQPSNNIKNSRTSMILKLWIFRLHKTWIRLIHGTTRWPSNKYIPTTWYGQPNRITHKFTNSNNRNSSRCIALVNST